MHGDLGRPIHARTHAPLGHALVSSAPPPLAYAATPRSRHEHARAMCNLPGTALASHTAPQHTPALFTVSMPLLSTPDRLGIWPSARAAGTTTHAAPPTSTRRHAYVLITAAKAQCADRHGAHRRSQSPPAATPLVPQAASTPTEDRGGVHACMRSLTPLRPSDGRTAALRLSEGVRSRRATAAAGDNGGGTRSCLWTFGGGARTN